MDRDRVTGSKVDRVSYGIVGLDEVVVREPTGFHLEFMSDHQVWLRVERGDLPAYVVVLTSRGKITGTFEED